MNKLSDEERREAFELLLEYITNKSIILDHRQKELLKKYIEE